MTRNSCLWYALDKWSTEGGAFRLVRSTHWCIPHCQHVSPDGVLTHFVPPGDLKAPWHSLFGFEGEIKMHDDQERGSMSPVCMFFGTLILLVFGAAWFVNRQIRAML